MAELTENNENVPDWLNLLHNAADDVGYSVEDIKEIANALDRVGLEKLSYELWAIVKVLIKTESDIRNATNLKLSSDVKDALNMTGTMFNALVAGGELAKKKVAINE